MIFYQNIFFLAIYDVSPTCIICTKVSDNLNPMNMFMYFDTVLLFASMHLQPLSHKLLITETFNMFCFAV